MNPEQFRKARQLPLLALALTCALPAAAMGAGSDPSPDLIQAGDARLMQANRDLLARFNEAEPKCSRRFRNWDTKATDFVRIYYAFKYSNDSTAEALVKVRTEASAALDANGVARVNMAAGADATSIQDLQSRKTKIAAAIATIAKHEKQMREQILPIYREWATKTWDGTARERINEARSWIAGSSPCVESFRKLYEAGGLDGHGKPPSPPKQATGAIPDSLATQQGLLRALNAIEQELDQSISILQNREKVSGK